jgi:hypothetical protein
MAQRTTTVQRARLDARVRTMAAKTSRTSAKRVTNASAKRVAARVAPARKATAKSPSRKVPQPVLLAGGNPQIAKADGDAPVQAYIAAMP